MNIRAKTEPWGTGRLINACVGALVAVVVAGLIALITTPIVNTTSLCQADQEGNCQIAVTSMVSIAALFVLFFLIAYLRLLGWQWAAWMVAIHLVFIEVVIETNLLGLVGLAVFSPLVATALTLNYPNRPPSPLNKRIKLLLLILILLQFIVWFILLLT